ncbi:hypothetical protein ACHAXA_008536 [Cyclostephanos tholiformis]|uniref:Uncharacterized protein n=1 Tax=Cyclostephanos tholiformis TaxID=382380 RepID=A0ABD3RAY7_9STRA
MLSICSVLGIFMRMMSATWFRLELGAVFSEDSALGTNLPLNVWSCFLLGLLCSGGDAMGIVYSKVLGGGGPGTHGGGSGSGMWRAGMGVSGSMINAVRAGMNRARRRGRRRSRGDRRDDIVRDRVDDVEWNDDYDDEDDNDPSSQISDIEAEEIGTTARRRRCNGHQDVDDRDHDERVAKTTFEPSPPPPSPLPRSRGNLDRAVPEYTESTIAGLLGLDDEFRIAGVGRGGYDDGNGEDEIRQVQLRGLSRRIMASPSIAFFPARKEANDVLEHYECGSSISRDSQLGDVMADDTTDARMRKIGMGEVSPSDVGGEDMPGRRDGARDGRATGQSSKSRTEPQNANPSGNANGPSSDVYRKLSDIGGRVVTYRRLQILEGWNSGTSPEEMKHIILLGLRLGFCGALGTFASLNASVILLLKSGKIGEALVGYAISIQLGIVSYRWGQYLAVYIFVWRCRLEERRAEKRGYGLRLRRLDSDEEEASDATSARKRYIISVRSLATVLFVAMFVSLGLAIYFFPSRRQYFISLIFTPFGCLARWKLMTKYNKYMPGFPLGTFACNIGGCALSGSLTSFLAGNLSSEETSVLHSMIAGFAGALSTFSAFIVEILSLMDPIIFKFDGMVYAMITVLWAVIVGIIGGQAKNWADEI